jgi:hypothetical protein
MNINEQITDDELEDCFEGSSNIDMVREILEKPGVVTGPGIVDSDQFAEWFAYAIEGFIDAEQDTEEWREAWDINFDWGLTIADNINDLLEEKNSK